MIYKGLNVVYLLCCFNLERCILIFFTNLPCSCPHFTVCVYRKKLQVFTIKIKILVRHY